MSDVKVEISGLPDEFEPEPAVSEELAKMVAEGGREEPAAEAAPEEPSQQQVQETVPESVPQAPQDDPYIQQLAEAQRWPIERWVRQLQERGNLWQGISAVVGTASAAKYLLRR